LQVLTSFPRRDLTQADPAASLAQLQLCPQETLTLEAVNQQDSDSE